MVRSHRHKAAFFAFGLLLGSLVLTACSSGGPTKSGPTEPPEQASAPAQPAKKPADYSKQYPKLWSISDDGPAIPALEADAVPQGLAYWAAKGWLIISNYKDTGAPSILTVVDQATGDAVKSVSLLQENGSPYIGHAGGVAVSGRHLWISSGERMFWIALADLEKAEDQGKLAFAGSFGTSTRASFTTFADGVLWVGEFASMPDYPTDPEHRLMSRHRVQYNAWVEGYVLDKETDLLPASKAAPEGDALPDYILSVPDKIQGMAVTPDQIILSQSFGRTKDSYLLKYEKPDFEGASHEQATVQGQSVPVWFLDRKNLSPNLGQLTVPPMSEGIITDGGNRLYVLFESAAKPYRATALSPMDRLRVIRLDAWNKQGGQ